MRAALVLLLVACAPKAAVPPPVLFDLPPPALPAVDVPEVTAAPEDCPAVVPFLAGQPPPNVVGGRATCAGVLVPTSRALDLYARAEALPSWQRLAQGERDARLLDRSFAELAIRPVLEERDDLARSERRRRWITPASIVLGFVLGSGLTIGVVYALEPATSGTPAAAH